MNALITEEFAPEIDALCRKYAVKRLDIFGSAATGDFNADSDVDFVVQLQSCTPVERKRRYFALLFALEELFGRQVDLIEESAITNPYFRESVEATRRTVYAA